MKRWCCADGARGLVLALAACGVWGVSAGASAAVLFQQALTSGLGGFTAAGTVTTSAAGTKMVASTFGTDGAITSPAINTAGQGALVLTLNRSADKLLTSDKALIEYSANDGAFTALESVGKTAMGSVRLALPASAAGASVKLRFRINGLSTSESMTVNSVVLSGSPVGSGGGTPTGSGKAPPIGAFTAFESGHVRPMALSSDGTRLYVVNTPDNRVEVFDVSGVAPVLLESIAVGLEPVAVSLLNDHQLWVVNHLSDSVSVVDVSSKPGRVVNTLLVGDEPRDIVMAGPGNRWAFITAAHRGQNTHLDPQLHTAGVGRADVWVYNTASMGAAMGGAPVTVLNMFGDTLRALARNADGSRVYAAVFNSGNKTTVLQGNPFNGTLDKAPPLTSADGNKQPSTSLIVQKNAKGDWVDSGDPKTGTPAKVWNSRVKLDLPDYDVFTIDTTGSVPKVTSNTSGVGTTLFNIAVNPLSGKLYVSNQEALNLTRFEGPGTRSTTVRGHFVESRITVVNGGTAQPRHLNKHITSYANDLGTASERAAALATPMEMAVTPDGATLYLAAMGSNKLARFSTGELEANTFVPSPANQLVLTGGAPTGVVLDPQGGRVFVTTRYDNGVSVVSTDAFKETAHVRMYNPEPAEVVNGRRFMYDANLTSSRGDSSCAGCHIFGDMDHLAWDLGNPDEKQVNSPNLYNTAIPAAGRKAFFHPMKGPMTTQSFRGMQANGPMHWRGDRTGASHPVGVPLEEQSFRDFNVAFKGLLGRETALTDAEMAAFAKFAMSLIYPPNPIANLDKVLTPVQSTALNVYNTFLSDGIATCNGCHRLDEAKGQFGTDGTMSIEGFRVAQDFKIPHLRNMYQKVGMFARNHPSSPNVGPQVRGFGFENGGAEGSISVFLNTLTFVAVNAEKRTQLDELMMVFPSDLNPIVGQQLTITPSNAAQADVKDRLNLLVARALVTSPRPECELVAKGVVGGQPRGWVMNGARSFVPDRAAEPPVTADGLLAVALSGQEALTFTCLPPGSGTRFGIDRNGDGVLDND